MHDVAEKYYQDASAKIDEHRAAVQALNEQLIADLMAFKVAFDAQWVRRIRDFRGDTGELVVEETPLGSSGPPDDQSKAPPSLGEVDHAHIGSEVAARLERMRGVPVAVVRDPAPDAAGGTTGSVLFTSAHPSFVTKTEADRDAG